MEFTYLAKDESGNITKGAIEADSREMAIQTITKRGLVPQSVRSNKKTGASMEIKLPGSKKVKPKALVIFTRQFSTMVSAGVPMMRALTTLQEQTESPALKEALRKVVSEVEGGASLSDSLEKHPKIFSKVYVNMVRAGEAGGILDSIMNRLATQVEKDSEIKGKFKSAMIYPVVVSLVAVGAVGFLMVGVIPNLANILKEAGAELPFQTKIILGLSDFLTQLWYVALGIIIGAVVLFKKITSTEAGRYRFHQLFLKIPIFGDIILKVNVARFARTFSSLVSAGVTVIEALDITCKSLNNLVIQKGLQLSIRKIKDGATITEALDQSKVLPAIIVQMTAVGEETGKLGEVLDKVAEFYEEEVTQITSGIASIIEPVLIVGLGGIVGFIVLSVLGPILSIQGSV
ncbi:type II secretion system F family protein [Candidatus Saccharibacteria bacterium]|nr:type II secretion system F family protein [Candidatus Saccharibacteria bacterium]